MVRQCQVRSLFEKGNVVMRLCCNRTVNVVVLACSISLMPLQQLLAANPFAGTDDVQAVSMTGPVVRDVALGPNGVMKGQVVDAQGTPCANAPVRLIRSGAVGEPAISCRTDADGRFQVAGVSGGVYRVETTAGTMIYRAWAPNTAPPSAIQEVLVVEGEAVRGNLGSIGPLGWALIGVGIAAAIAIPLALDDDDAS